MFNVIDIIAKLKQGLTLISESRLHITMNLGSLSAVRAAPEVHKHDSMHMDMLLYSGESRIKPSSNHRLFPVASVASKGPENSHTEPKRGYSKEI